MVKLVKGDTFPGIILGKEFNLLKNPDPALAIHYDPEFAKHFKSLTHEVDNCHDLEFLRVKTIEFLKHMKKISQGPQKHKTFSAHEFNVFVSEYKTVDGKKIGYTNYCGIFFLLKNGFLSLRSNDGTKITYTTINSNKSQISNNKEILSTKVEHKDFVKRVKVKKPEH